MVAGIGVQQVHACFYTREAVKALIRGIQKQFAEQN